MAFVMFVTGCSKDMEMPCDNNITVSSSDSANESPAYVESVQMSYGYSDGSYTGAWENELPNGYGELMLNEYEFYKRSMDPSQKYILSSLTPFNGL